MQFLKDNAKESTLQLDHEKMTEIIWNEIKENIEKSTLIDAIYLEDDDYKTLTNELADIGSLICLSHYNLVPFSGSDKLNSFFSDQGKFRDLFVNHNHTVIYLSGHTHMQECTIIENPIDQTNKLVCITSPPFFKVDSSLANGFNLMDVILRKDARNIYKPIGCKVKKFDSCMMNGNIADFDPIRFSGNITNSEFSDDERKVIKALKNIIPETGGFIRSKNILSYLNSSEMQETKKFDGDYLHEILMNLWWIGVINKYSAIQWEIDLEGSPSDYVGGVLCLPMNY